MRAQKQPQPLTPERLSAIERFARRSPPMGVSDTMAHHQECRKLIVELVKALREPQQQTLFK